MWKIEKLTTDKKDFDIAICIKGFWVFSFMWGDCQYQSLILFNHIIWDRIGD